MKNNNTIECPKCGQVLRFPENLGGMLMACPTCGKKFYSDFKFHGTKSKLPKPVQGSDTRTRGVFLWLYHNCFCLWFKK
ncbi:MAG: hypothetical protein GY705_00935 [Bacteroidetes bacterium]|nr:hypothetical protein [Bacteroidota bacterium]